MEHEQREARIGVACGISAYVWWGLLTVLYFRAVRFAGALEVVTHRVVWSVVLLALLITLRRRWRDVREVLARRDVLVLLLCTSAIIALNWLLFIHAIATDRLIQASLGYFINPLLSVLLGCVFLRERLRMLQLAGVLLASAAVIYLTIAKGAFPGLALGMAGSFAVYGLLRKVARVEAVTGLLIETVLLLPISLGYLIWLCAQGSGHFLGEGAVRTVLLVLAGPVTAIPLLLFVASARRLRLATVGFMQYLAPTGQFLLAVLAFGEHFDRRMGLAFAGIWTALALYSADTLLAQRRSA